MGEFDEEEVTRESLCCESIVVVGLKSTHEKWHRTAHLHTNAHFWA